MSKEYAYPQMSIAIQPRVGFWVLSSAYGIAFSFYTANFYSWGLSLPFLLISLPILLFSPILGAAAIHVDAWILRFTGRLFGVEKGSIVDLRSAVAWSKAPSFFSLAMWAILSLSDPTTVFVHYAESDSAAMIVFISLSVNLWSFGLLIKAVRGLQGISTTQAIVNTTVSRFFLFLFYLAVLFIGRYVYILSI